MTRKEDSCAILGSGHCQTEARAQQKFGGDVRRWGGEGSEKEKEQDPFIVKVIQSY